MLTAYFSHSWKSPHLAVNLRIWERLAERCQLLIDQPVQELGDASPPWYISRIEALMRRADVFVACLPPAAGAPDPAGNGDWRLRCSPYMLFELRLAERANLPRFVAFDQATLLRPLAAGPHARYLSFRFGEADAKVDQGVDDPALFSALDGWLAWVANHVRPKLEEQALEWGLLAGDRAGPRLDAVWSAARAAGFGDPVDLADWGTDAALAGRLRSLAMLVADVADPAVHDVYHYAHATLTPTVRLLASGAALPPILSGHPAGYQEDLVCDADPAALHQEVEARARSLARNATPIVSVHDGRYELQQRQYKRHLVFISHNLHGPERALLAGVVKALRARGIDFWEYEARNQSGDNWRKNLEDALAAMTHFVPLFSNTYEQSPTCKEELEAARSRPGVVIRPFLLGDREKPNPDLRSQAFAHHPRLPADRSPDENGEHVAQAVLATIRRG